MLIARRGQVEGVLRRQQRASLAVQLLMWWLADPFRTGCSREAAKVHRWLPWSGQHDRGAGVSGKPLKHKSSLPVVLLVHRLPAHAERVGDGLPTPALLARVGDVDRLQPLL